MKTAEMLKIRQEKMSNHSAKERSWKAAVLHESNV
jgi:hypothetical protein